MLLTFSYLKFLLSTYLGYSVGYGYLYPHASINRTPSRHCRLPVFSRWRSSCHSFLGRKSVRLGSIHRECTPTTTVCSKFDGQGLFIDHLCCLSFLQFVIILPEQFMFLISDALMVVHKKWCLFKGRRTER